jgi:hypothetical protein
MNRSFTASLRPNPLLAPVSAAAGPRGWRLEPDAPRRNDLPPPARP